MSRTLEILKTEVEALQTGVATIYGSPIKFGFPDTPTLSYAQRVFAPFTLHGSGVPEHEETSIEVINDQNGVIRSKLLRSLSDYLTIDESNWVYGQLGNLHVFGKEPKFLNIYDEDEDRLYAISSARPGQSLASSIKRRLMRNYAATYPQHLFFHAACLVDLQNNRGIVLGSSGEKNGNNRGKTTTVLSTLLNCPRYGFFTNDDIVLNPANNYGEVLPFPTEINVRQGTYVGLQSRGVNLLLEEYTSMDENGTIFTTTSHGLSQLDFTLSPVVQGIQSWLFLDLKPGGPTNRITEIDPEIAAAAFTSSVGIFRHNLNEIGLEFGEVMREGDAYSAKQAEVLRQRAADVMLALSHDGLRFYKLTGDTNFEALSEIMENL